jgi:uncharacterized lipoprotein YddW (UPF0748 family)
MIQISSLMSKIKKSFLLLLLCLLSVGINAQTRELPRAAANVRAVWVRPFNTNQATEETRRDPIKGRAYIRAELDRISRAGLNTVYVESLWDGYTIYPSLLLPQRPLKIAHGVARKDEAGQTETWDVLQTYLDESAKLGLSIHAWFHVFHQWNSNLGSPDKSPIFSRHPEWMMLDVTGSPLVKSEAEGANRDIYKVFMSPSHEGVGKLLRLVVQELCQKYPALGGVQWDYIRYPVHWNEAPFDYSTDALMQFQKATGLDARKLSPKDKGWKLWQDWKTQQVTEVVKQLNDVVRKLRPKWIISAAVFPGFEENLRLKMQDSREWAAKGYVDALLPMLYSRDYNRVESWAKEFREAIKPPVRVYPAFFIGHFYEAQTRKLDERYLQIEKKFDFDGIGFFAAQSLTDNLVERLAREK